jgi:hypothetical protein
LAKADFVISVVIRSLPILLFLGIVLFGCHTEAIKEPRPVDFVLGRINGTWKTDAIRLDGVEKTIYKDFTVSFSGKENEDLIYFTTTGRPVDSDFPESGSLKLGPDIETDLLVQPDGWVITYRAHDSQLELSFIASKSTGFDPSGWTFSLKR